MSEEVTCEDCVHCVTIDEDKIMFCSLKQEAVTSICLNIKHHWQEKELTQTK